LVLQYFEAVRKGTQVSYITFENVTKEYRTGGESVLAANEVSFEMEKGELCVVLGPSGAGKTTILNLLGGMDKATSGRITVGGKEITSLNGKQLTQYRRLDVGFVFQFYNLMPNLTALENVELARQVCPNALNPVEVLGQVGLSERMNNFPAQLSGGEQQRVSIARALCKNPALLLCDEPTGALDSKTGLQVLSLLKDVSEKYQTTVAIITHNAAIAPLAKRVIRVRNGRIESVEMNEHPASVEEIAW
jgi:putative ABC transport system ATP-binding protein